MTLQTFDDLEQRSEAWYDARRGIVTASVVGRLVTPATRKVASNDHSRALTMQLAAERIAGWTPETYRNGHMIRGVVGEPIARDYYSEHFAPVREVGFMVEDKWGVPIGYSPDGLVGDDGLIEVKCPEPKTYLATVIADKVPAEHMPQIQCGLLVSGRAWCDFITFVGGLPLYPIRVHADPKWQDAIITAVTEFERAVTEITRTYESRTAGFPMTERLPEFEEITF
jgi:putative phage-type endonuclease